MSPDSGTTAATGVARSPDVPSSRCPLRSNGSPGMPPLAPPPLLLLPPLPFVPRQRSARNLMLLSSAPLLADHRGAGPALAEQRTALRAFDADDGPRTAALRADAVPQLCGGVGTGRGRLPGDCRAAADVVDGGFGASRRVILAICRCPISVQAWDGSNDLRCKRTAYSERLKR